jgi:hypothetical protein
VIVTLYSSIMMTAVRSGIRILSAGQDARYSEDCAAV